MSPRVILAVILLGDRICVPIASDMANARIGHGALSRDRENIDFISPISFAEKSMFIIIIIVIGRRSVMLGDGVVECISAIYSG